MVDEVTGNVKSARKNIDSDFQIWCKEISEIFLGNWESLKLFPERQAYRGFAQTLPVLVQLIITKKSVAIPLLDSLIIQIQDRLSDEDRHARHLLYLVPSINKNNKLYTQS